MGRRRPRRGGWSTPGPVYRAGPGIRLASTAFGIWWASVVLVVLLDTRDLTDVARLGVLTALLMAVVLPGRRAAVVASPLGLHVNNGWRERFLRWSDIDGFRAEFSAAGGRVGAVLRSGEVMDLAATRCRHLFAPRRRRQIESIRRRLASYRHEALADCSSG